MASYDVKAILGEKLKRLTDKTLKAIVDCMCVVAASLCSLDKRISALESVEMPEGGYKPMQEPVASPSASGTEIQFIDSVSQDATGRMTATKKTVRSASTSETGVVQLTDSHSSTSTSTAATPKNVKEAYDLASSKADPASVVDSATYDSSSHTIVFKHGSTQLFTLDAAAFVKDGMVDSAAISNGNLVITFNTDAGKQPISIPLTDIFNPNNYYTKSATDVLLASKVDSTDSRLLPDADVALILYGDSNYSTVKALYNAGKKLYLVTGGSIQPSGKFEYRIPLTQITYDANSEVNAFYFEVSQDDRNGASEVGSIAVYRLDSTGWTTTPKQVGYAVNAGHSASADVATNATNDHGGAKIRDVYISNVVESVYDDATTPPQYIYSFGGVSVAANQDGFRIATLSSYKIPFPRVYFHTRSELTVRNPTDPSSTTPGNYAYIINNSTASYGYNGFTVLGHEKPIASGQKYYGVCRTELIGGLTEIDFDFSASWVNHIMEQQNFPPSFMQIVFAATWDNNDFKYGFPIDDSNIFTTTRGSYRYEQGVSGFNNDMPVMGHVRMVGVIGNAGIRRLFIGAFQPRDDVYIRMKISNVRVRGNLGAIEASAT